MAKRQTSSAKPADPSAPSAPPKPRRARAAAKDASAPPTEKPAAGREPRVDDIRRRAYERYLERGGNHGQHDDDWITAEEELRNRK